MISAKKFRNISTPSVKYVIKLPTSSKLELQSVLNAITTFAKCVYLIDHARRVRKQLLAIKPIRDKFLAL